MAAPNFYASSPTVVLPPQQQNQYISSHYSPLGNGIHNNNNTFSQAVASNGSEQPIFTSSLAGRKRSRGDIMAPDDDDEEDASTIASIDQQAADPTGMYDHDSEMTTTDSRDSELVATTQSQVATSTNESVDRRDSSQSHMKRPSISSRKSQRVNQSAEQDHLAQLVLPPRMREATSEPLIDEATRVLGVSWARMDSSEVLQINQAAYQKWIQRYYPSLQDVSIWFENKAIPGYLVQAVNLYNAQQGWYIFSHDLIEARLVTTEASQLVPRLNMLPALHLAAPGGQIYAETDSKPMS